MTLPLLIGLLGAECTGKSTLARDLAEALAPDYAVVVAPEALRDFVRDHGRTPRQNEQNAIMAAQVVNEHAAIGQVTRAAGQLSEPCSRPIVVCDPCALMTAIYSMAYFSDPELLAAGLAHQRAYDLVLWCGPDISWTPDPGQRDGPERRTQVAELLATVVSNSQVSAVALAGDRKARLRQAMAKIHLLQRDAVAGSVRAKAGPPE